MAPLSSDEFRKRHRARPVQSGFRPFIRDLKPNEPAEWPLADAKRAESTRATLHWAAAQEGRRIETILDRKAGVFHVMLADDESEPRVEPNRGPRKKRNPGN